jgi:hypothetical protein
MSEPAESIEAVALPSPPAHKHDKIVLLLMNCLERALPHVDAVAILDAGSTNQTAELCRQFLTPSAKPFSIAVDPSQALLGRAASRSSSFSRICTGGFHLFTNPRARSRSIT